MVDYVQLREEVVSNVPHNFDVSGIKTKILENVRFATKRRVERIKTVRELVKELENQLLIFPEKRGINVFYLIAQLLQKQNPEYISSHTLSKVRELTERLKPPEPMPSPLAKLASPCRPAPASIKDILVSGLTERGTGKDWEHFARGLGSDRQKEEYDKIRVREGDLNRLERRNCDDTRNTLRQALEQFERNCIKNNVNIDVTDHIIDILLNEEILDLPYKRLARQIKEAKRSL